MNVEIYREQEDGKEITIVCDCKYWSATRGYRDKYGALETPDDPAEIEIQSSKNKETVEDVELTDAEQDKVIEKGFEQIADVERDYPEPEWHEFDETPVDNN